MGALERIRQWAAGLGCSPAEVAALAVLASGALAAVGLLWLLGRPDPVLLAALDERGPSELASAPSGEPGLAVEVGPVVVHVAGQVVSPGIYRLPGGARVADALEAAGGPRADAALDALNLARPLTDGEQVSVPGPEEAASELAAGAGRGGGAAAPAGAAGAAQRGDGTLDLNRATAADLEELPGIGPVLAERIVAHRDAVGGFKAVGDLRDVPGIGEKILAAIAPLVGV